MQKTLEDTLATLVAMPTISDDTAANEQALDYIEKRLAACGMYAKRFMFDGHGSLVATVKPDIKKVRVLLYAHVDVMPATEEQFTLRYEGDKLRGRGVFDMKFTIAGYLHVVEQIKGRLADYDFGIVITTDEEYGGRDNLNSIPHLLKLGYGAEVCIMPDGARNWDVEAVAKGAWRFDLIAKGKSAHGSRPWEGESASFKLIQALHELRTEFEHHGPETDTLNIGKIHGDGTYNQLPATMTAGVEIRLATDESYENNQTLIKAICKKHDIVLQTRGYLPLLKQDINNPLIQGFMRAITEVTGHQSKPCLSLAASDAVYFNNAGIPCAITYPPGGGHHSENEWIDRTALRQFPEVMQHYLDHHAKHS